MMCNHSPRHSHKDLVQTLVTNGHRSMQTASLLERPCGLTRDAAAPTHSKPQSRTEGRKARPSWRVVHKEPGVCRGCRARAQLSRDQRDEPISSLGQTASRKGKKRGSSVTEGRAGRVGGARQWGQEAGSDEPSSWVPSFSVPFS